jgi:hypothetical protein
MKKVLSLALMAVVAATMLVGVMSATAQADDDPQAVQCIIKCHIKTLKCYECCRIVTPGGGGKWVCEEI